ncbi:MAG: alpha-L-fucosidase [Trueperaceae bacterium]|nr:alpha-L-fucosidase [Trueperaceae bacterium]
MLTPKPTAGDTSWFTHDRFGMFIHWGLYALPARHEWIKQIEQIPDESYDKYFRYFNPDLYNPEQWAEAAANAGMKYVVVTSKHHDGFCLWDSTFTDYKAPNTPYGKDVLSPMLAAFKAKGMRLGLYHSIIDWHHPEFPIDDLHSMRNHPDRAKLNETRDITKYASYLHGQTRELLERYDLDIMWFDFSYPAGKHGRPASWIGKGKDDWQSEKLLKMIRELKPSIILNDRLDLPDAWDIKTPEQYQPQSWLMVDGEPVVWEACQTFSGSWGYHRDETSWKSVEQLIHMLIDTVSKGGNLLLNVGPTGRGEFDARALDRLAGMGRWMHHHSRSIYGCTQSEFTPPVDCRFTQNGKKLYLHLFSYPFRHVHLEGFAGKVDYAQFLHDASEVKMLEVDPHAEAQNTSMSGKAGTLTLELPVTKPDVTVPVIELFLN